MIPRYLLRFETGERRGEEVPVAGPRVRIGRRPLNDVRILDASVSGEHAELRLDGASPVITDCGSTNGVRVGGERVAEHPLRIGDVFALGSVQMRLLAADGAAGSRAAGPSAAGSGGDEPLLEGFDDAPAAGGPSVDGPGALVPASRAQTAVLGAEDAGEGVGRVSTAAVERSGRRSLLPWIAGALVIAAGAFLAWQRLAGGPAVERRVAEPLAVAGNLLPHGAFEAGLEDAAWEPLGEPPVEFDADEPWRHTGLLGAGVELVAGEWSALRSDAVRVRPRRPLVASAWLRVEGDAGARLGLRLESSAGRADPIDVWGPSSGATDGFEERSLAFHVPAAFDRASLLAGAGATEPGEAGGLVALDDAALVQEIAQAPEGVVFEGYVLSLAGDPPRRGFLFHIDRVLLSDLRVAAPGRGRAAFFAEGDEGILSARATETGARLELAGVPPNAILAATVDPELTAGGIATTGPAGYRAHSPVFEEPQAESVLLGTGLELVRLVFPRPVSARGRPADGGYEMEIRLGGARELDLQLSFLLDRDEALQIARSAREAEARGELGAAMRRWGELLNAYPFEAELVRDAEETRGRLLASGLQELQDLERELERSRFFGLSDLTRQYRERVVRLGERYAGTEVERGAEALRARIDEELAELEAEEREARRERLAVIAAFLEQRAPDLAEHVAERIPAGGRAD